MTSLSPKRQAVLLILLTAVVYIILARPVERVTRFVVAGNRVYLTAGPAGFRILDIVEEKIPAESKGKAAEVEQVSRPVPQMIGSYNTLGYSSSLALRGNNQVLVADGSEGVIVLDITDLDHLKRVGKVKFDGKALDLAVWKDDTAYVAAGRDGIRVVKIKKNGEVSEQKEARLAERADVTRIVGDRLFVGGDEKLKIFDLKDAAQKPDLIGSYSVNAKIQDIQVVRQGDRELAYIAADKQGVLALDVTQPMTVTEALKIDTIGRAMGVFIHNGYALVAEGNKGMRVYDLAFKEDVRPFKLIFETWGETTQVAADGRIAYLADGFGGLRVLDYMVPLQVESIESKTGVPQASAERAVVSGEQGSLLFLADGGRGLRVLRAGLNEGLVEVSFYDTPGYASAAAIRWPENQAVVADKDDLLVLDIADLKNADKMDPRNRNRNPPRIRLLGAIGLSGESDILDVELSTNGQLAYLANGDQGFWVADISDPAKPRRVGVEPLAGQAVDLSVAREHAFIAGNRGGLIIVTVKDSQSPARIFPRDPGEPLLNEVMAVDTVDRPNKPLYVYTASREGLCVTSVYDPEQPGKPYCLEPEGRAKDVMIDGNRAYLVATKGGDETQPESGLMYVFSINDPANPVLERVTLIDRPLIRVMVNDERAYLSMGVDGLRSVRVQDPAVALAAYHYPPLTQYFIQRDQIGYVTDGDGTAASGSQGLSVLDLSDKKKPRQVGLYHSAGEAHAVALHPSEKVAYLADGSGGLHVIDVSDPGQPRERLLLPNYSPALHVATKGNRLFLAGGDRGLWVFDITDPFFPRELGFLSARVAGGLPGPATWLGVYGDYVLVACRGAGLASVWLQDGRSLQLADTNQLHLDVRRFFIRGDRLYAGAGVDGMVIYSLDRPRRIEVVKSQPVAGIAEYVHVLGAYAFVAMGDRGIQILMIENETRPIPVGASLDPRQAVMLQATGPDAETGGEPPAGYWLYVAEGSYGLRFYQVKKDLMLHQSSVYETPGTASLWEVFNFVVTRINALVNQTRLLANGLGLGFVDAGIEWVQGKITGLIKGLVRRLGTDPWPMTGASEKAGWTLQRVLFFDWLVLGWFGLLFWAAFVAQFVLPVQGYYERRQAVRRMWAFIRGRHGTMTRVYDGQIKRPPDDAEWRGPGVALVDVVSAAVLEKRLHGRSALGELRARLRGAVDPPPDAPFGTRRVANGNLWNLWQPMRERIGRRLTEEKAPEGWPGSRLAWELQIIYGEMQQREAIPPERVEGRQLVFTETGGGRYGPGHDEVVAHGVDLRNQFRITGQEVLAHTHDGIELWSLIFCIFSVSQEPATLLVTYLDGVQKAENVRVVYLDEVLSTGVSPKGNPRAIKRYRVKELSDELDAEDKQEIHDYVQASKRLLAEGKSLFDLSTFTRQDEIATGQPFALDRERVFAAAASRADDKSVDDQPAWHELPVRTAVEVYRNLLSQQDYDVLYRPTESREYPMSQFKSRIGRRVRNLGMINFQYIERLDKLPMQEHDELDGPVDLKSSGKAGENGDVRFYPVQALTYPKVLRARGIKVITAGSTEMRPMNEEVRRYFFENWRARWQRDAELRRADYEIEAQRIRNQARMETQRDMVGILARIFASERYGREAMALRVFQALERVAADPLTRQFLPNETIYMLNTLQRLLLPEDNRSLEAPTDSPGPLPPTPDAPHADAPDEGRHAT